MKTSCCDQWIHNTQSVQWRTRFIFALLFLTHASILYYEALSLSITYHEAKILFYDISLLHYIVKGSLTLFGQNDLALRLPMIFIHLLSIPLLYILSKPYVRGDNDRLWIVLIYMLLPGLNSAALLVDGAGLVVTLLLLYVVVIERCPRAQYILLLLFLFIDISFAFLYLGLFFFALKKKDNYLLVSSLLLFGISMFIHGFNTGGAPEGNFLDTLGIYAAIFSPFVFIYLVYILYRRFITSKMDLLFYLSTTALVFSLLLSFRQRIEVQMFAPYLVLAIPLAAQTFFRSYRVRLRQFRKNYRRLFVLAVLFLLLNALVVFFNKELYQFMPTPQQHFAYRSHIVKELAKKLKEDDIHCIQASNKQLQLRLRFYDINECDTFYLSDNANTALYDVTISYSGVKVYQKYVTKNHK